MHNQEENKKIVTRYAPSPTGFQHVGGIRTAIYAWAWARKNNGTFILRIEDTDKEREVEGAIPHAIECLKWLGINWDEGVDIGGPNAPYLQSERLESYKKYAQILIEKGHAYPDPYSEEEVASFRKQAEDEKRAFLYRDHRPATLEVWDGTKPLRFKVPEIKSYTWNDAVRGELTAGPEALDDFILIKTDGYPTYNFAHIIDDLEMGVTHIMRADEFIASTPKFLSLYDALEITPPVLVTLPPILGTEGTKKLSKRDGAKDILEYKNEGYLPDAMVNFLALIGWNPGGDKEIFSKEEFVQAFDISRIHKSGAMFNEEKLEWVNKEHMKKRTEEENLAGIKPYLSGYKDDVLKRMLPMVIERITHYGQISAVEKDEFAFFKENPIYDKEKLLWKDVPSNALSMHLSYIAGLLKDMDMTSVESIKAAIFPYAEEKGKGDVLWPLRVALSGKEKSADPFTLLYVLGKDESLLRITQALALLASFPSS